MAWSDEDAASAEWFRGQAERARPGASSATRLGTCGRARPSEPPWWAVGSHLDSVRGGGRFDGPLGVACGFEIAAGSSLPLAVLSFADEEGARFNTPTFGSKALAGRLDLPAVLERADAAGVRLEDAMRSFGVDPAVRRTPRSGWQRLARVLSRSTSSRATELERLGRAGRRRERAGEPPAARGRRSSAAPITRGRPRARSAATRWRPQPG